jgi:hypothetical protein
MLSTQTESRQTGAQPATTSIKTLQAITDQLPWGVSLSKRPGLAQETITFTSTNVGVLEHTVTIESLYDPDAETHYGYRITKSHNHQDEPTVVEERVHSREAALAAARECMKRLTA